MTETQMQIETAQELMTKLVSQCKTIEDFEKLLPYVYNTPPAFQASPPQAVGT